MTSSSLKYPFLYGDFSFFPAIVGKDCLCFSAQLYQPSKG
jgi:hypothetical protein